VFGFRADFSELNALLDRIHQFYKNDAMKRASTIVIADVKSNADKGVDAEGVAHKPYTSRYKKKREKLSKQTDHVDFEITGGLKKSLEFDETDSIVTVDDDHKDIAEGLQHGVGKNKVNPRNWLDAGTSTGEKIEVDLVKGIDSL
jgi:hypothetical protein